MRFMYLFVLVFGVVFCDISFRDQTLHSQSLGKTLGSKGLGKKTFAKGEMLYHERGNGGVSNIM